jgi:hypothetical protein
LAAGFALEGTYLCNPLGHVRNNQAVSKPISRGPILLLTVRPTRVDVVVARFITRNTAPAPEGVARALTWDADEKVLLAAVGWLASRGRREPVVALATMLWLSRSQPRCYLMV